MEGFNTALLFKTTSVGVLVESWNRGEGQEVMCSGSKLARGPAGVLDCLLPHRILEGVDCLIVLAKNEGIILTEGRPWIGPDHKKVLPDFAAAHHFRMTVSGGQSPTRPYVR